MKPTVARMLAQLRQLGADRKALLPWLPEAMGYISASQLCRELLAAKRPRPGALKVNHEKALQKTNTKTKKKAVRRTEGPRRRRAITPELEELILSDLRAGKAGVQVAREYRISRFTIQVLKKKASTKKKSRSKKAATKKKASKQGAKKRAASKKATTKKATRKRTANKKSPAT